MWWTRNWSDEPSITRGQLTQLIRQKEDDNGR
jgi:hypothetical protein